MVTLYKIDQFTIAKTGNNQSLNHSVPVQLPPSYLSSAIASAVIGSMVFGNPNQVINPLYRYRSFADDFYGYLTVSPLSVNLSSFAGTTVVQILFNNSSFQTLSLSSVNIESNQGVTLDPSVSLPKAIPALSTVPISLIVSGQGAALLDCDIGMIVDGYDQFNINIKGSRLVSLVFIPQSKITERLEYKTDIITTRTGEQRIAIRPAPSQTFDMTAIMTKAQYMRLKGQGYAWVDRQYGFGEWSSAEPVSGLTSGDTVINLSTVGKSYVVGGQCNIYSEDTGELLTSGIYAVSSGSITLTEPLLAGINYGYIMPTRVGYINGKLDGQLSPGSDIVSARLSIACQPLVNLGSSYTSPATYNGVDVVIADNFNNGQYSDGVSQLLERLDDDSGLMLYLQRNTKKQRYFSLGANTDMAGYASLRSWLDHLLGRQREFYTEDRTSWLQVLLPYQSASVTLTVEAVGYGSAYGTNQQTVMMRLTNGGILCGTVASGAVDQNNTNIETLTLIEPLTHVYGVSPNYPIQPSAIESLRFMPKMRLNSDSVTITHDGDVKIATIPLIEALT